MASNSKDISESRSKSLLPPYDLLRFNTNGTAESQNLRRDLNPRLLAFSQQKIVNDVGSNDGEYIGVNDEDENILYHPEEKEYLAAQKNSLPQVKQMTTQEESLDTSTVPPPQIQLPLLPSLTSQVEREQSLPPAPPPPPTFTEQERKVRQTSRFNTGRNRFYPELPNTAKASIQSIDVQCVSKQVMIATIIYDQPFDGVIYPKGYYSNPECFYAQPNSGQMRFVIELRVDQCGVTFFRQPEPSLEATLVFQYDYRFQEIWDTVRHLRCVWRGTFTKELTATIAVDMLNIYSMTYTGDSGFESFMEIQYGEGPFSTAVSNLVQIGDNLTLVIHTTGANASEFDVAVKDCIAHDGDPANSLQLTDSNGCILKKKLMGAWQRIPINNGLLIYSFMHAFRFPNKQDVFFQCNTEICKEPCQTFCPEDGQVTPPDYYRRIKRQTFITKLKNKDSATTMDPAVSVMHQKSYDESLKSFPNRNHNITSVKLDDKIDESNSNGITIKSFLFQVIVIVVVCLTFIFSVVSALAMVQTKRSSL
ncbi:uncharacterized protein B4U79_09589 [Dinothrombium tinctorium]|uniref:ZP domain-containing protein n=1 Tax=Dinothrombium tinctorium TaxID=1965070 RepID=A0A3S3SA56_9ACAR|nr:uncharacterized protein B4U79_09589 [Dinothrombium tinctorium]